MRMKTGVTIIKKLIFYDMNPL